MHGEREEIDAVLAELFALDSELKTAHEAKLKEYGEETWYELLRKLMLQMIDIVWVEHLEVMQYTRSAVSLRAYGQKDPLQEYKREGARLFVEMQQAVLERIAGVLPNVQAQAVEKEEEQLRKERAAAQRSGGTSARSTETDNKTPRTAPNTPGRNDLVKITNGTETKE